MTEYRLAKKSEYEKFLNFGNYVFSQAHCPHDFRALLPKTYKDAESFSEVPHFIAIRDDGEIRGLVALRDTPLRFLDKNLSCGFVGTVSVHPYARGEGHMKQNMANLLAYANEKQYDLLVLGGQRQRYGYFGFESGGAYISYHISATNLRHVYGNVDETGISFREITEEIDVDYAYNLYEQSAALGIRSRAGFLDCLKSWTSVPRLILDGGSPIGYIAGYDRELMLEDEEKLPRVLKALFRQFNLKDIELACGMHMPRRMQLLGELCEYPTIAPFEMLSVLNWVNVLNALMGYKAAYARLEDGERTLVIEGKPITIRVEDGKPVVTEGGDVTGAPELDHMSAQRLFFGLNGMFSAPVSLPFGWTGIPFFMSTIDGF